MRTRSQSDPQQIETTWLFPHVKEVVRIDEVARALNISEDQVHAHLQCGNFLAVPIGDAPQAKREHVRLMRFSVEAWWLNRLEDQGINLPVRQSPQVTWWRGELRAARGRSGAGESQKL